MRNLFFLIGAFFFLGVMVSCTPNAYYQLVNTKPKTEGLIKRENSIVYEDENCVIHYNFWENGGTIQIVLENKTNEDIYLDMTSTFFLFNGFAIDLYTGKSKFGGVTESYGSTIHWGWGIFTNASRARSATEVSIERPLVVVPAKLYKVIGETNYVINKTLYRDCNLFLTPNKRNITSSSFSLSDTPYTFGLRIAYSVGNSQELIKVRNEFYVDKITNYPYDMFVKLHRDDSVVCPDETVKYKNVKNCIYKDVDAFYIKYVPGEVGYSSGVLYKH
jgi:hypothetical protein